jgi:two-component system response regulator PilR (NtrC family)
MSGQSKPLVLVVDDDESICQILHRFITRQVGFACDTFREPEIALNQFRRGKYAAAVVDLQMPKIHGLNLLQQLHQQEGDLPVIVLTAHGEWENAINAMRLGAFNFINKDSLHEEVESILVRAVEQSAIKKRLNQDGVDNRFVDIVGKSAGIRRVQEVIRRISSTDSTVLITGESGTGKELVARSIHLNSSRLNGPFVAVNCGAFPDTLLESELFGHVKGAFTGALSDRDKVGMFELANRGSFFFDEIGDTSPIIQVKLLRVLETREIRPVGGVTTRKVDARVIAATNKDLAELVNKGQYRFDLYYRLNVIPIQLPPLRERKEDIPLLVGHFIARLQERARQSLGEKSQSRYAAESISASAWDALTEYNWPGNVRELENVISRAFALMRGDTIRPEDLGLSVEQRPAPAPPQPPRMEFREGFNLEKAIEAVEISYINQALDRVNGCVTDAAKLLGVSFRTLRYKIHKYKINR